MTTLTDFMQFVRDIDEESYQILIQANAEYASEEEKFDNFEGIAAFMRRFNPRLKEITPQDVAWIYRLKHMISIIKGISIREDMRGRVIDDLNYGRLIAGMNERDRKRMKDSTLDT